MCSRHLKCWSSQTKISTDLELHHRQIQSQPSTSQVRTEPIVCVRNGCKHYGTNRNPVVVLDGLNLTVPRGTIYGLLGASGCGKTTLLGCILGQKKLSSGQVWVFGELEGTKTSGAHGPRIGYMPQENALLKDFTIQETFVYFGWIANLNSKQIQERSERLMKLLRLPETNQRLNTLSGGEQRRVSFAAVLLHEPELLILDEPTVGLDPILRESIWHHLLEISNKNNTTIIMTTHYIEELRQAHVVGLMRGGKLLAENSPGALLAQYKTETLDETFLKLSVSQDLNRQQSNGIENTGDTLEHTRNTENIDMVDEKSSVKLIDYLPRVKSNRLKALIWKNVLWWKRNTSMLILSLVLSVLQISFVCLCIGADPRDISVAVINYETNNSINCKTLSCNNKHISCNFFEYLKKHSISLTYHSSEDDISEDVLHGNTYALFIVPHNYTSALLARINEWEHPEPWDIQYSNIEVFQDVHNYQITNYLKIRIYDAFQNLLRDYLQACNLNPRLSITPIKWESPIYGVQFPTGTDALFPGMLLTLPFLLSILLTSSAILIERSEASLERTFAMGITTAELLISHIVCELVITVVQSILAVTVAFSLFNVTHNGSTVLVMLFTSLSGFLGMCYGIFISCIFDSLLGVNVLAIGTTIPTLMLCGALWPVEGVHYLLKPIAMVVPLTHATEGVRDVLQKNWDLSSGPVYMGLISLAAWIMAFLILSFLVLQFKFKKGDSR